MIYFNACPKCHGDLTMNQDGYGAFVSCLQCGFMRDIDTKLASRPKPRATPVLVRRRRSRWPRRPRRFKRSSTVKTEGRPLAAPVLFLRNRCACY